jgi:hypothetical protein
MGLESWFRRPQHMESGLAIVDRRTPRQQREIGAPEEGLCTADGELIIIYRDLLDFGTLSGGVEWSSVMFVYAYLLSDTRFSAP